MAESSIFWTTNGTGDGGANYTESQLVAWLRRTFIRDVTTQGVLAGYANGLKVTGTSTPVSVATGAAMVYGFPYESTGVVAVAVATPSVSTRIDRIVLRVDWTAQTVRIARVAGVEGGSAPALTQTANTTWDISLAQVAITTGGVITVTDERSYCRFNTPAIDTDTVTPSQTANVIKAGISTWIGTAAASGSMPVAFVSNFATACDYVILTPVSLGASFTVGIAAAPAVSGFTWDWTDTDGTTHTAVSCHYLAIGR